MRLLEGCVLNSGFHGCELGCSEPRSSVRLKRSWCLPCALGIMACEMRNEKSAWQVAPWHLLHWLLGGGVNCFAPGYECAN
jgi:hypothetical protein